MLKKQIKEVIDLLTEELNAEDPDIDDLIRVKMGALIGLSEEQILDIVE